MDMPDQIVSYVRRIEGLRVETAKHWTSARKSIDDSRMHDAISLLNAYFHLKRELEEAEARLESLLHSNFSDK